MIPSKILGEWNGAAYIPHRFSEFLENINF